MGIKQIFDILIPRFMTEDVALMETDEGYEIVCAMSDIEHGEEWDGIATMKMFNMFGFAMFPRQIGEVRPWINPNSGRHPWPRG
jgi:hypothetical protein